MCVGRGRWSTPAPPQPSGALFIFPCLRGNKLVLATGLFYLWSTDFSLEHTVSCAASFCIVALLFLISGVFSIKSLTVEREQAGCGQLSLDMVHPIGYNSVIWLCSAIWNIGKCSFIVGPGGIGNMICGNASHIPNSLPFPVGQRSMEVGAAG